MGFIRHPLAADSVIDNRKACALQQFRHLFYRFAAPAVAAERRGLFVFKLQAPDQLQHAADRIGEPVIDGRRAHQDRFGLKHFRGNIALVFFGRVHQLDDHVRVSLPDAFRDTLCHTAGGLPHGIVHKGDLILLIIGRPLLIGLHDLHGIIPPDDAVAGADHVNRHVHGQDFLNLPGHHGAVGIQNVYVIFHGFAVHFMDVHFVIVQFFAGKMLAEAVIAEENIFSGHVGEHGVRPVQHGRFDENKFGVTQVQGVAGLYVHKVPVLMIVSPDNAFAFFGAVNGHIRNFPHQGRQGAAVIDLVVVHDHVIDLLQVDRFF